MESARKTSPQAGRRSASPVDGQASVELVAVLPALLLALVVGLQLAAAGWSLWSATEAARAGARAELVGDDGSAAALGALPGLLRDAAEVEVGDSGRIGVRVRAPRLIPGLPAIAVGGSAGLDPAAGAEP